MFIQPPLCTNKIYTLVHTPTVLPKGGWLKLPHISHRIVHFDTKGAHYHGTIAKYGGGGEGERGGGERARVRIIVRVRAEMKVRMCMRRGER